MIKFYYISGMGGSTSIDDISFMDKNGLSVEENDISISIYPNPATEKINIK